MANSAQTHEVASKDRLNIAFILPSFAAGGAERVLLNFAAELSGYDGVVCHVVVFDNHGPLAATLAPTVVLHDLGSASVRRGIVGLGQRLRSIRADAVFSTMMHTNLAVLALRPFLPRHTAILVREANLPSFSLARLRQPGLWRTGMRMLYPVADRVIASSNRMADELAEMCGIATPKLTILANPVDEDHLRARALQPERSPGAGRRFVAAGRLVPQKGFDRLLDIATGLPPEDEILIFGEGPERTALESKASAKGARVRFAGHTQKLSKWLAGADALLMPSRFEGLPNTALEALACGTPVVATPESGGIAEIAAAAPAGAVAVAEAGDDFLAAMRRFDPLPNPLPRPRQSLMPHTYRRQMAGSDFLATVEASVRARRGITS